VMFLGELEEVLEATQLAEFQRCMVPLFRQIARSMNSSHFQVKILLALHLSFSSISTKLVCWFF